MGNADITDDNRMNQDKNSSSPGRISAPPVSTPGTPQQRTTPASSSAASNIMNTSCLDTSPTTNSRPEEGSVRDLEAAMTRHLPEEASDFSTDALLRGAGGSAGGQRSTIQWVGGTAGQQGNHPASTLLRQLYVNRESVIRSSVQRPYFSEVQTTLPTPPGSEGYQDSMFGKTHDFSYAANGAVNPSGLTATSSYPDYHSAMTPPSSVSPREKMAGDCNDLRTASYLTEPNNGMPAQPLPLKPQVYSYGTSQLDTPSYSAQLTDQTSGLYSPAGFHLYHSNPGKSPSGYDSLRPGTSWYSPSS